MAGTTVTDEHVQRAWRRLRKAHWPVTLPEVLEHPLWGRCVRGLAQALANAERGQAHVQTPAPARPAPPPRRMPPPVFDRKRAAAGERETHPLFDIEP